VIVDNASIDENLCYLELNYPRIRIIRLEKNFGFGYAANVGFKEAVYETVMVINSDAYLFDKSMTEMILSFNRSLGHEIWSPINTDCAGIIQDTGRLERTFLDFVIRDSVAGEFMKMLKLRTIKPMINTTGDLLEVEQVYGTCFVTQKSSFLELGGFDERFFMYYEDLDLCDRFQEVYGVKPKIFLNAKVVHTVQGSKERNELVNLKFLKSKYMYAKKRFGVARTTFLFLVDFPSMVVYEVILRVLHVFRAARLKA
jgi:GT2 family glycosyltransferase